MHAFASLLTLALQATAILAAPTVKRATLDPQPNQPIIAFKDSKFSIAVVTDTHLLDGFLFGTAADLAKKSAAAVTTYIQQENPNYIVHLGDLVSGEGANSTDDVRGAVRQILQPIVDAGLPFSTTKGNHDNDRYSNHKMITEYERALAPQLSYTGIADESVGGGDVGTDNYWVPVYPNDGAERGSKPALILWFFDSRAGKLMVDQGSGGVDGWVNPAVGDWITSESSSMESAWGSLPPSIAFVHVPSHDFATSQQDDPLASEVGGVTNETPDGFQSEGLKYAGLNDDKPFGGQGGENMEYTGQDRGYLDAFMSGPGKSRIHTIVSGHQHGNDWCAPTTNLKTAAGQTVPVCFAKHSGYGGYDHDQWNHGSRIFEMTLDTVDKSCSTHIRMLTGETRYETTLDDSF